MDTLSPLSRAQDWVDVSAAMGVAYLIRCLFSPLVRGQKKALEKIFYVNQLAFMAYWTVLCLLYSNAFIGLDTYKSAVWPSYVGLYSYDLLLLLSEWPRLNPSFRNYFLIHHSLGFSATVSYLITWSAASDGVMYTFFIIWMSHVPWEGSLALIRMFFNPPWFTRLHFMSGFVTIATGGTAYTYGAVACKTGSSGCWNTAMIFGYGFCILLNLVHLFFWFRSILKKLSSPPASPTASKLGLENDCFSVDLKEKLVNAF